MDCRTDVRLSLHQRTADHHDERAAGPPGGRFVPRLLCFFARADRHFDWLWPDADRRLHGHSLSTFSSGRIVAGLRDAGAGTDCILLRCQRHFLWGRWPAFTTVPSAALYLPGRLPCADDAGSTAADAAFRSGIAHIFAG